MDKNKLNEFPLADVSNNEIEKIKQLENQLDDKYYLIAFEK
ncbi:hypothetical protein SH2C18_32760 [Clostridium sediminicola]